MVRHNRLSAISKVGKLLIAGVSAGVLVAVIALPAVGGVGLTARKGSAYFHSLPTDLHPPPLPQASKILAANGGVIARFYNQNRIAKPMKEIAPAMRHAMVAIEDSRFYKHNGVDVRGIERAAVIDLKSGSVRQGGSTLTQQYVENVLLLKADTKKQKQRARGQTFQRKIREMRYALALEEKLSKKQILNRYLNIAYFGDGAYGVEAAARHYFKKHASKLTVPEAAMIAGLVKAPGAYNPVDNPKNAKQRRNVVIGRMAQLGVISDKRAKKAAKTKLGLDVQKRKNGCTDSEAPFFCEYIHREILTSKAFGKTKADRKRLLRQGGLTIHTTLQWDKQRAAEKALRKHAPPKHSAGREAAEAMVEPGTGKIRALAVNLPYGQGKRETTINLAANYAHGGNGGFHAGSTFKAFTLATALSQHMPFRHSIQAPYKLSSPSGFTDCQGNAATTQGWTPSNAVHGESGTFNLKKATWRSVNTFFVKLERQVGLCKTVKMARKLGLRTARGKQIPDSNASFTLGTVPVTPVDMAVAYAVFASRGIRCDPIAITKVIGRDGKPMDIPDANCHRVLPKGIADGVSDVLQGVLSKPHATAGGLDLTRDAAGKTGSVSKYEAWFVGYTPDLAAAVWFGNMEGHNGDKGAITNITVGGKYFPHVYGASIPAPIWHDSMKQALKGTSPTSFHSPPEWMTYVPSPPDKKKEHHGGHGEGHDHGGGDDHGHGGDRGHGHGEGHGGPPRGRGPNGHD